VSRHRHEPSRRRGCQAHGGFTSCPGRPAVTSRERSSRHRHEPKRRRDDHPARTARTVEHNPSPPSTTDATNRRGAQASQATNTRRQHHEPGQGPGEHRRRHPRPPASPTTPASPRQHSAHTTHTPRRHHDNSPRTPRITTTPRPHHDHQRRSRNSPHNATPRHPPQRPHNDPATTSGAPQARSLKRRRRPNGTCVCRRRGLPASDGVPGADDRRPAPRAEAESSTQPRRPGGDTSAAGPHPSPGDRRLHPRRRRGRWPRPGHAYRRDIGIDGIHSGEPR